MTLNGVIAIILRYFTERGLWRVNLRRIVVQRHTATFLFSDFLGDFSVFEISWYSVFMTYSPEAMIL